MFIIVALLFAGIAVGVLLRPEPVAGYVSKSISVAICLLLLFLGIAVGKNKELMNNLSTIGWQALIITIGALAGSICLAWLVYRYFFADTNTDQ